MMNRLPLNNVNEVHTTYLLLCLHFDDCWLLERENEGRRFYCYLCVFRGEGEGERSRGAGCEENTRGVELAHPHSLRPSPVLDTLRMCG